MLANVLNAVAYNFLITTTVGVAVLLGHMTYVSNVEADEAALAKAMGTMDVPILVPEGREEDPYWKSRLLFKKATDHINNVMHDRDAEAWERINQWVDEIATIRDHHPELKEDSEYRWSQKKLERAILASYMRSGDL